MLQNWLFFFVDGKWVKKSSKADNRKYRNKCAVARNNCNGTLQCRLMTQLAFLHLFGFRWGTLACFGSSFLLQCQVHIESDKRFFHTTHRELGILFHDDLEFIVYTLHRVYSACILQVKQLNK